MKCPQASVLFEKHLKTWKEKILAKMKSLFKFTLLILIIYSVYSFEEGTRRPINIKKFGDNTTDFASLQLEIWRSENVKFYIL